MAKCSKCGKSGLFLKLQNGLCKNCVEITSKHNPAKSSLLPVSKPRNITVELLPLEQQFNRTRFSNHFDFMVCTLVNSRVRVDSKSGYSLGYLPADIADLCLSGHVKSVFFNGRDCASVTSSVGADTIKVDIFLVPSGGTIPAPPPDPLDVERGTKFIYPKVVDDCSIVYWYPSVPVIDVNREKLRDLVSAKKSSLDAVEVSVELTPDGDIVLSHEGVMVGKVCERQKMCADWLNKKLLLRCVFSCYKDGAETVALAFYRNDLRKYSSAKYAVVKLTSFRSEDAQFCISSMKGPEKLKIHSGSGRKILDIYGETIGNLPKKYQDLYDEDGIDAVYFDHFDSVEDDDTDEAIYVPYVKLYLSE